MSGGRRKHVVVVGAGIGGLSATLDLAGRGHRVTLVERAHGPGGKMREIRVAGAAVDSGPTVFTMRPVFEALYRSAGLALDDYVTLARSDRLARHSWLDGSRLDLYSDVERSAAAIDAFAGAGEAEAYRAFAAEAARIFDTLDAPFMQRDRPGPVELSLSMGARGLPRLVATRPFESLMHALQKRFRDRRLQQLFARYATYCGSSPFEAPATLMLIAHAERAGVWRVEGGMQRLADGLARAAMDLGAELRYASAVDEIIVHRRRACGVVLGDGSRVDADAVIFNGDVQALTTGLLGDAVTAALPARDGEARSLSALTWSLTGHARGFPLDHHTVFFGDEYREEFERIFHDARVADVPTVYVCAQDRPGDETGEDGPERLFVLVNAPPRVLADEEIDDVERRTFAHLDRHGLSFEAFGAAPVRTAPQDFDALCPASDGAIYGWPTHGWFGSFRRSGARSRIAGLYLAGGTVHPGPGVPMVALSGRIAAAAVTDELDD